MAWPSGTKASTANVDSGSDNPALARVDIKQNIDNVNDIIDEFGEVDITSPVAGQALVYDGVNSKWINGDASGTSAAYIRASLSTTATFAATGGSAAYGELNMTVDQDDYSLVNSASGSDLNLDAGSYLLVISGMFNVFDSGSQPLLSDLELYNDTATSQISDLTHVELTGDFVDGRVLMHTVQDAVGFTLGATSDIQIRFLADANTSGASTTIASNLQVIVYRR